MSNTYCSPRKGGSDTLVSSPRSIMHSNSTSNLNSTRSLKSLKSQNTPVKSEKVYDKYHSSYQISYENVNNWSSDLIKDKAKFYFDHILYESSRVWSISSIYGYNNTSNVKIDCSIFSGFTGRFLVLLKKYSIDKDRDTLKKLKIVKNLCIREIESCSFDVKNIGVLSSHLGCLYSILIYKELTNDLSVDKLKIQSQLSQLFREAVDPVNFDYLGLDFFNGLTSFLYVFNYIILNNLYLGNYNVDILKYTKIIFEHFKKSSWANRMKFQTILKSSDIVDKEIFYFDVNKFSHPCANSYYEILSMILVSFTVFNKYQQNIDPQMAALTLNSCAYLIDILKTGPKNLFEDKLMATNPQNSIGYLGFLINVQLYYNRDTSGLINNYAYHLITNGASINGDRLYNGTLSSILNLLNIYKYCNQPKLYDFAIKMLVTLETAEYKKYVNSMQKNPSLDDRPYGLYEGQMGLLWVLYEFVSINQVIQRDKFVLKWDKLFGGYPAFDLFVEKY